MSRKSPPDVRTKPGGGGAGSWLVMLTVSTAPISPASIRAFSAWKLASKRRLKPSSSLAPASFGAAARARARSRSIGFSQKIALPAAWAARHRSRWVSVELATITPATSGSASAWSTVATVAPASAASASAASATGR